MTIGQFAQVSGLTPKTLRFYAEKGLLTPYDVDAANAYRRYHPSQIRRAATIKVLRHMGMSLPQVRQVLDDPDRAAELVTRHRVDVEARHAAQREALAYGAAVLDAYDRPSEIAMRTAPEQPWVGAVLDVDPSTVEVEEDTERYNGMFGQLWRALEAVGNAPVGAFWTTLCGSPDGGRERLLLCWPVARQVDAAFAVEGLHLRHGILPDRTEVFVRLNFDDPHFPSSNDAAPHPGVIALLEALDELDDCANGAPTEVRQVGVLGEDQLPVAIDIAVTAAVSRTGGTHVAAAG